MEQKRSLNIVYVHQGAFAKPSSTLTVAEVKNVVLDYIIKKTMLKTD